MRPSPLSRKLEKEAWPSWVAYARSVGEYTEFALFSTAIASPPEVAFDLFALLEQQNPKSKYFASGNGPYRVALTQTGGAARATAVAEKAIANFPGDENLLIVLAGAAMNRQQLDHAGSSAELDCRHRPGQQEAVLSGESGPACGPPAHPG